MQIELSFIECPRCKKWYSHTELMSYSTYGNIECWSDGKCINNNMSEYSFIPFSKCDTCDSFFWIDDCRKISDYEIGAYIELKESDAEKLIIIEAFLKNNPEYMKESEFNSQLNYPPVNYWENMPQYIIPDYIHILKESNDLCRDREVYIRTKLRQHINDLVRNTQNSLKLHFKYSRSFKRFFNFKHLISHIKFSFYNKKLFKEYEKLRTMNLIRLSELHNETIDYEDSKMELIEIERELGNFEKAKALVDSLDPIEKNNNKAFIKNSLKFISKKTAKAFVIK